MSGLGAGGAAAGGAGGVGALFSDVRRLTVVDSTNRYVLDEARAGAPAGLVAVADFQQAGRGRLGRTWEAPAGACLLASILLRPVLPYQQLHLCTAAVALSAIEACRVVAGVEAGIKWPNDLIIGDAKVAGVLAEADRSAAGGPNGAVAVVVGIGINIDWEGPPGAGGTSLRAAQRDLAGATAEGGSRDGVGAAAGVDLAGDVDHSVDRDDLLSGLLVALTDRAQQLESDQGRSGLAAEFRRACVTLGRSVRVELDHETVVGTATDLTDDGHLVVALVGPGPGPDRPSGAFREIAAGDVIHLRPVDGS